MGGKHAQPPRSVRDRIHSMATRGAFPRLCGNPTHARRYWLAPSVSAYGKIAMPYHPGTIERSRNPEHPGRGQNNNDFYKMIRLLEAGSNLQKFHALSDTSRVPVTVSRQVELQMTQILNQIWTALVIHCAVFGQRFHFWTKSYYDDHLDTDQ